MTANLTYDPTTLTVELDPDKIKLDHHDTYMVKGRLVQKLLPDTDTQTHIPDRLLNLNHYSLVVSQ